MCFNTGFYREGDLVMQRGEIALNYLGSWFLLDLIATFPYNWVLNGCLGDSCASVLLPVIPLGRQQLHNDKLLVRAQAAATLPPFPLLPDPSSSKSAEGQQGDLARKNRPEPWDRWRKALWPAWLA